MERLRSFQILVCRREKNAPACIAIVLVHVFPDYPSQCETIGYMQPWERVDGGDTTNSILREYSGGESWRWRCGHFTFCLCQTCICQTTLLGRVLLLLFNGEKAFQAGKKLVLFVWEKHALIDCSKKQNDHAFVPFIWRQAFGFTPNILHFFSFLKQKKTN